ncbi:MAG TPA: hypothetical protein VK179_11755 [Bacteroidales bacterium]|nr:hypothetical protein [Bacteroidales bacterium]
MSELGRLSEYDSQSGHCLIPLYLGVTGHRNIREEDKRVLKEEIKKIILEKKFQCPDTPVKIITPLAEGADRLAAEAAIECDVPYIAPLPMPVAEYRKDFVSSSSNIEFDDLLNKAEYWFELPVAEGVKLPDLRKPDIRNEQYFRIGQFVARHSYLLIALWDGMDNLKKGGTAHIVRLKKTGLPQTLPQLQQPLNILRTGSICHILTPRQDQPVPPDAFSRKMIYPDDRWKNEEIFRNEDRRFLRYINSYNQDVLSMDNELLKDRIRSNEDRLKVSDDPYIKRIAAFQVTTDTLATRFNSKRFFALKVLLILTVLAFLFFQVYVEFWHKPVMLLLYPLTMGMGALWFLYANRRKYEQKHEDYRALAEAFRVQYFLACMGNNTNVSDYYLQKYAGDLEWIIYALRSTLLIPPVKKSDESKSIEKCRYLNDFWVSDQLEYYRLKSMKHHYHHERYRWLGNVLFLSALASAVVLFLFSIAEGRIHFLSEESYEFLHSVLIVCTHSFLVIAGALLGYNEKRIFEEQSKTFQKMFHLFSHAYTILTNAIESSKPDEAESIIHELALESLMENADWLLLHRSRPMEIPKG